MTILQRPDALSFSMNLKPFKINTPVDVSFSLVHDGVTLLTDSLSPDASDMVEISLRDVIHDRLSCSLPTSSEPYVQTAVAADFTAVIGSQSVTFRVIRGGIDRPSDTVENFLRANFLTWQPTVKPVTYSSPEYLSYYPVDSGCTVRVKAYFTDSSGSVASTAEKTLCSLTRGVVTTFSVQYAVIAGLFSGRLPAYYDVWVASSSDALTYTQRYYADVSRSEAEQWIFFENSLGGIDTFRAYGTVSLEAGHVHNIAEIDDVAYEYRVDTERKFTVNTGFLDVRERRWLLDFFPSAGKYVYAGSLVRRIVVVDDRVEYTLQELPSSFSFTFRIADALPLLNLPRHDLPVEMLGLTVPDVGSFTLPPRLLEFPRQPLSEGVLFPVQEPYSEEWAVTTLGGIAEYVKGKIDIPAPGMNRADLFGILGGKPRAGERINPEFIDLSEYLTGSALGHYATLADLVGAFEGKLDTQFFASVFTVYDEDGNPIVPNTYEQVAENLQVMVGTWTERYLSALGKNPDEEEGGGGVSGIDPVEMWKLLGGTYQTNEVIGVSHIPGLPADKITSGIFSIDRIPNIPLTKIPDLQQTLQQLRSDVNAKLDTRFFASVFTVYDEDGNPIVPNTYEQAAENLQVMVGAWTERYLSALGKNDDESGGGGMSPEELWTELGSSPWTDRQISADHLTDALAGYVKKISFGSKDYAAVSGTVTIPVISNNPTLAFGAAAEILKLGDTSVKVTMPAANITEGTITIGSNSIKPLTGITSKHVTDALGYTPADVNELLKYYTKTEVNAFTWWGQKLNDSGVVSGDMTMNNGDAIIWKSPSGNAVATQSVLTLNSSNNVHLGSTDKASTHNTYINGVNIHLRTAATGTARGNRVTISSSGAVSIAKTLAVTGATTLTGLLTANGGITILSGKTLQIGGATLSWDSANNMLKVDTGFYSEKSVSALGANDDSGSGGGELDEGKMWGYLGGSMDNKVISLSHIPELETLTFSYGSVASASGSTYNGHTARTVVIPNTLDHIADGTTRKLPVIAYKDKKFTLNNSDLVSAATIVSDGGGIKTIKINGTAQAVTNNAVNLPAYPTLKGLMGSTPIGAAKTPIYWDGSGFKAGTQIKDLAYKDSLAFSEITDKPTTLSGYGITDAYTESEIDTKVTAINESIGNKADKTINISAGNGLQGGGDLTEDRTLSIKLQSNSGLTVASAGLKLDIINNLTTANAYKAISATQAKKIWDLLNQMFTLENTGTSSAPVYRIKANYGLYSEQYISALGANDDSGSGGGELDEGKMWGYLGGSMDNKVISLSHIPELETLTFSYGSVASASGSTYNGHTAKAVVIPKSLSNLTNDIASLTENEITNATSSSTGKRFITPYLMKTLLDKKTDTKNTAGSTDTSDKIFLIGAKSQDANPQTYSHDTAYVGTNGHLYSNSKQVVNLSDSQALTNKTYNGYTLAAACAKDVDTSVTASSTSTNLPTSKAVAELMTSSLTGYLPLSGGTMKNTNLVTNLNADLLDGYHATSFTKRVTLIGGTKYRRTVIALCQLTDASVSAGTFSNGRITFHRTTGINQDLYADVAFNAKYAGADTLYCCITSNARNFSTAPVTGSGVRPCRFTYGGNQYGGVEFFYRDAQHDTMAFYGETNFDIFCVDYYDTRNEVAVNTEIYDSIDYTIDNNNAISAVGDYLDAYRLRIGNTATIAGLLRADGSVYIPTGKYLRIGEAYLTYDTSAKMIKVWDNAGNEVRGIYATGAVSSLGANTDTSGGGVVDEEQVWGYLASSDSSKKIHSSHIDYEVGVNGNALTGISVSNGGKLSFSKGYFVNAVQYGGTGDVITGYNLSNGTLTLTKGSITTIPYLKVNDVRGTVHSPNSEVYPVKSVTAFFNQKGMPASGWHSGLTVKGWSNDYQVWQIASRSQSSDTTSYLYYRIGRNSDWEAWRTILDTKNYTSYTYSKTDERTKNYVLAAPNGGDGAAAFRALVAADIPSLAASKITSGTFDTARIPDLRNTYASASRVNTLEGYFTGSVANVAAKLNTGTTTYSAWGQTYWQNGVPNSVSGDMTGVETITFNKAASGRQLSISKSGLVNFNAASAGGWAWGLVSHTNDSSAEIGCIGFLGNGDAVDYAFVGGTYNSPHLVVLGNKVSGKEGYVGIGTTSPVMTLHVDGTLGVTEATTLLGLLTANGGITIPAGKTLQIGSITLTDDNGLLKIDKGVYSLGTVSALGANTDTSGGGTGFDESDMWEWLGGSMTSKKIDNSHLNFTIGDYLKKSITNDTQTATANQEVVVGIEYNGSTGGLTVKKSAVTLSNYLPLSAGSGNALTGNLCFGNNLGIFMKNSAGANCQVLVLNSSSSGLHLGGSANAADFNTYVSGKNVYLRYVKTDGTWGNGLSINQSGLVTIDKDLTVSGTATLTGAVTASSSVTASSFIKSGGTSSQFLKADGSVDSNTYATTSSLGSYLPLSAGANHPLTGHLYMGVARNTTDATYNDSEQRIYGRRGNDNLTAYFLRSRSRENKSTGVLSEYICLGFVRSATIAYATVATDTQGWTTLSLGNDWLKESHENSMAGRIYLYAPQADGATTVYTARITPGVLTASRTQTLPNITGTFIMDAGAQTITGVKTFSNGLTAAGVNTGFIEMKPTGRTGDGGYIDFHYNNSDADYTSRIIEDSSGHLHIYADSGVYISGYVTSANEVTASSDERLKNIAGDIRLSVKDIASAPSVYFYWKDGRDKKKHIGSIAQYWEKVLPESVSYDGQGYMSLNYQATALAAAIAIAREVSEHESRLTKLERENKALKKRITKLETELERRA